MRAPNFPNPKPRILPRRERDDEPKVNVTIDRDNYQTILSEEQLDAFIEKIQAEKRVNFDLETTSLNAHQAEIVGFALAVSNEPAAYVPVAHRYLGMPKQMSLELVLEKLKPILENSEIAKMGQNLKYDMNVLARIGLKLEGLQEDSMLAAYILDATRSSYSLDALARDELQHETISYKSLTGTGKKQIGFDEVPVEDASRYASEDADVALKLCQLLAQRMQTSNMEHVYRDLEIPLVPVLAKMEQTGIKIDVEHLQNLSTEFTHRLKEIEAKAHELIDHINLASPKQLSHVFFEKLGYPVIKKTKTGYSTDQEVLETLAKDYELPGVVLEYRMLSKLKSTYVDALPKLADQGSQRVHTSYNQTGTATGRLSSTDPNLQNIPIREARTENVFERLSSPTRAGAWLQPTIPKLSCGSWRTSVRMKRL